MLLRPHPKSYGRLPASWLSRCTKWKHAPRAQHQSWRPHSSSLMYDAGCHLTKQPRASQPWLQSLRLQQIKGMQATYMMVRCESRELLLVLSMATASHTSVRMCSCLAHAPESCSFPARPQGL